MLYINYYSVKYYIVSRFIVSLEKKSSTVVTYPVGLTRMRLSSIHVLLVYIRKSFLPQHNNIMSK